MDSFGRVLVIIVYFSHVAQYLVIRPRDAVDCGAPNHQFVWHRLNHDRLLSGMGWQGKTVCNDVPIDLHETSEKIDKPYQENNPGCQTLARNLAAAPSMTARQWRSRCGFRRACVKVRLAHSMQYRRRR
jgi:hypothetical protein